MDFISDYNTYEIEDSHAEDVEQINTKSINMDFLSNYKSLSMSKFLNTTNNKDLKQVVEDYNKDIDKENINNQIDEFISKKLNFEAKPTKLNNENNNIKEEHKDRLKEKVDSFVKIIDTSESLSTYNENTVLLNTLINRTKNDTFDFYFKFKTDIDSLLDYKEYNKISNKLIQIEANKLQIEEINNFIGSYKKLNDICMDSVSKMKPYQDLSISFEEYKKSLIKQDDLNQFNDKIENIEADKLERKVLKHLQKLFTLNLLEHNILYNEAKISDEFLQIIDKLIKIKQRCIQLGQNCNKLLNKIELDLNFGLNKIYNNLITLLTKSNELALIKDNFQVKLQYLYENDLTLHQKFLNKFTDIEYKKCVQDFLNQFDINNQNMIILSNNSSRYLGDVLAHVHSIILNEYEFINQLVNEEENIILNNVFNKFTNMIKIRLEQVIKFENDSIQLIEYIQILSFYKMIFLKKTKLNDDNLLIKLLDNLLVYCNDSTIYNVEKYLNDELQYKSTNLANMNLQPPNWLYEYLNKLILIMSNFDDYKVLDIFDINFFKKFDKILIEQPLIDELNHQFDHIYPAKLLNKDLNLKISSLILRCNCLDLINSRLLLPFSYTYFIDETSSRTVFKKLNQEVEKCFNLLEEITLKILFKDLQIYDYYNLLNMIFPISSVKSELDYQMYFAIKENPIINLDSIEKNVKVNFEEQLPLLMTNLESKLLLNLLNSPLIINELLNDSFKKFFKFYKTFHNILKLIFVNDTERLDQIFKYTDDEVYTILGLENYLDDDIYIEKEEE
ncbi:hypothetical protein DAHU10_033520 [Hanseniaspora uvarum]|nr:hypothetical protein DAHU10_033520 [Hanseniaspora uvarum]